MNRFILCFLLMILSLNTALARELQFYRYENEEGVIVIDSYLPPKFANKGYEIVTSRGNVIETISPRLNPKEMEAKQALDAQKRQALQQQEKIKKQQIQDRVEKQRQDNVLLQIYGSTRDIERSRNEKISAIEVLEGITRGNIHRLEEQLEDTKKIGARYERKGKLLPKKVSDSINDTKNKINELNEFLERKNLEKKQIKTEYFNRIKRFQELTDSIKE